MTVTLTLDVPADLAERVHALPADTINRYAVAALPGLLDAAEGDAGESDPEDADMSELPPLPPSLTQSLADDLREGFADLDAGRVVDGETFFAELREYARNGQNQ